MDKEYMIRAIELATKAESMGNLPVGSLITYKDQVVAEGHSMVYQPDYDLTRHAEMEAIRNLPKEYWKEPSELTIYTTLEPCLMCMGAILLFGIGRVVYGAADEYGGAKKMEDRLPPFFKDRFRNMDWIGPLMPEECDPLHRRLHEIQDEFTWGS